MQFRSIIPALLVTAILGLFPSSSQAQGDLVDGIAAVVNGDVITFSQVREVVAARERSLHSMYSGQELVDKIKEARLAALKDLIDRQLIIQEFTKQGLKIPDRIIEENINRLVEEQFGGDRQVFLKTLQAQGYTLQQFRNFERDKIMVQAMRQRNVRSTPIVSPQKIRSYYDNNKQEFSSEEQVKLRMIVINKYSGDESSTPETQKAIADEIRTKLVAGGDFARMAQVYSEDSTRDAGGDWGWVDRTMLNQELTREVFKLKAGQISPVVSLGDSYYILMVEARKSGTVRPFDEVKETIENRLLEEERLKGQQAWIDTLRKKAYIKMY